MLRSWARRCGSNSLPGYHRSLLRSAGAVGFGERPHSTPVIGHDLVFDLLADNDEAELGQLRNRAVGHPSWLEVLRADVGRGAVDDDELGVIADGHHRD